MSHSLRFLASAIIIMSLTLIPKLSSAQTRYSVIWQDQPGDGARFFLGAANLDDDVGDELVYFHDSSNNYEDRIYIVDAATGSTEWEAGSQWIEIMPAGFSYDFNYPGSNYGYSSPLCDIDADGQMELTFAVKIDNQYDPGYVVVIDFTQTGVDGQGQTGIPRAHSLSQNYPNPFNPKTTIEFELTSPEKVSVSIYNILGQEVRRLVDEEKKAGNYSIEWDGKDDSGNSLASGTYFYRLRAGDYISTKKSLLLK